ncbi:unnamed protein product [Peniophora sp. CBMAI 1063]|nr:unnamed protein product [Peniophora sp. CBMAI 1063]
MDDSLSRPWFPEIPSRIQAVNDTITLGKVDSAFKAKMDRDMNGLDAALRQLRATRNACNPCYNHHWRYWERPQKPSAGSPASLGPQHILLQ